MSNKQKQDEQEAAEKDPLVLSISEHEALSEAARQEFRAKGGTVSNQP